MKTNLLASDETRNIKEAPRLAYTLAESAKLLGISYVSIHRLIARGLLRPNRSLRHKLLSRVELERFLSEGAE
jgi:hypothetical protein